MNNEIAYEKETAMQGAMHQQLELLRNNLAIRDYPGYPQYADRLVIHPGELPRDANGAFILPDGPWETPPRFKDEVLPDIETTQTLRNKNITFDSLGRPLHPWFNEMVQDATIGIVTGRGAYWHWGPNYTADSIVLCQNHVLLVKRKDTGLWALPGGHVDPGETALAAAPREVAEETGVFIPSTMSGKVTYKGPVVDLRVTAHAWPETTAVLYRLNQALPEAHGMDDAAEAAWVPLEVIEQEATLFGSHRFLLSQALAQQ